MGSRTVWVVAAQGRVWPCPSCGDEREFVQPPCADGHADEGGECPDWACADCGAAVTTGAPAGVAPAATRSAA